MSDRINILDCTLRDGGYVNSWKFNENTTKDVIYGLTDSNIEIVECGFLDPNGINGTTRYNSLDYINNLLPSKSKSMYVSMIELDKYDSSILPEFKKSDSSQITGIRLTVRPSSKSKYMKIAKEIKSKGYDLFLQPICTVSYSDREVLDLIDIAHELNPLALYIVDTHGSIDWNSYHLRRIFSLMDRNLNSDISIGFHSHNNLQLSYALACELASSSGQRNIILDSSLLGMGRGVGNLHTEMICNHLNNHKSSNYDEFKIIELIEKHIKSLKDEYGWGYSVPYFLTAINKCHPNYADYLIEHNFSFKEMNSLLKSIPDSDKLEFNKNVIKELIDE